MRYILLITLIIVGCSSPEPQDPPGVFSSSCNGHVLTIDRCFEKAKEKCPNGYEMIERNEAFSQSVFGDRDRDPFPVRKIKYKCKS